MLNKKTQETKAQLFHSLHHNGKMLVLPNIWDPLAALLIEDLGYQAIATASASIAFSNGHNDGENMPFNELLTLLSKITRGVNIPVTADIESGYADTESGLQKNIERLVNTGIVGINLEDTNRQKNTLFSIETQCKRIGIVRKISEDMNIPLFINARTDVYIRDNFASDEEKFEETIKRGRAYLNAGADCIFPIVMKQKQDIQNLISVLKCPINILTIAGVPDLKTLSEIGVARVSLGPSFLKIAIRAMKNMAVKLKNYEGIEEIYENEITTDYLKNLVHIK
ncbi:MAG: isocitrate lyase/PEP mutase family protein [Bacteroidia bacterium]